MRYSKIGVLGKSNVSPLNWSGFEALVFPDPREARGREPCDPLELSDRAYSSSERLSIEAIERGMLDMRFPGGETSVWDGKWSFRMRFNIKK
jgi:hypothetical protein